MRLSSSDLDRNVSFFALDYVIAKIEYNIDKHFTDNLRGTFLHLIITRIPTFVLLFFFIYKKNIKLHCSQHLIKPTAIRILHMSSLQRKSAKSWSPWSMRQVHMEESSIMECFTLDQLLGLFSHKQRGKSCRENTTLIQGFTTMHPLMIHIIRKFVRELLTKNVFFLGIARITSPTPHSPKFRATCTASLNARNFDLKPNSWFP